jgi:hypothetical protein
MSLGSFTQQDYQTLLESYSLHGVGDVETPTLMEIAGFPYRENVYSNILAFLLDSQQPHGFGAMVLRALVAAYQRRRPIGWLGKTPGRDFDQPTVRVDREVITAANKKIDILAESSDFVFCIENKIWSDLHNDLGDYRSHCESATKKSFVGVVLAPDHLDFQRYPALSAHEFVSLSYADLVAELERIMGQYVNTDNTKYQFLLFDFLAQARRLQRNATMDEDERAFLDFWTQNSEKLNNIEEMKTRLKTLLRAEELAVEHIERTMEGLEPAERAFFKTPWIYGKSTAVFDVASGSVEGCGIYLDVEFHPLSVRHRISKRRGLDPEFLVRKIEARTSLRFHGDSIPFVSDRGDSPFNTSAREAAVADTIGILKAICALGQRSDQLDTPV